MKASKADTRLDVVYQQIRELTQGALEQAKAYTLSGQEQMAMEWSAKAHAYANTMRLCGLALGMKK